MGFKPPRSLCERGQQLRGEFKLPLIVTANCELRIANWFDEALKKKNQKFLSSSTRRKAIAPVKLSSYQPLEK